MRDRFLWGGCALYAALLAVLGTIKYAAHRNLVDFGIFAQTAASAFGCFCNPLEGSHWAFHFSPVLYAVGAILRVARNPFVLIALPAITAALCAPPVYAMIRARADVATARWAAMVVWLYPPLAALAFGDFHENAFAPAAVAWTLYAFDAGKLRMAAICAALTLAVKEDQALFLAVAGVAGAVAYRHDARRARFAVATAAAGIAVAALFFFVVQPHAAASPHWQPQRFYAWAPDDWRELVPAGLLQRAAFLALILAPLAFVPLRTPAFALAVAPLAEVLASRMSTTFTLGTHYAGAWIGYVLAAFAAGIGALAARGRARAALTWSVALCAIELAVANPLHPGLNLRARQPRDAALDRAVAALPPGANVATQEEAYTHLALRDPNATLLPERPGTETTACYVLIDRDYSQSPRLQEYGDALASLVKAKRYALVSRDGGIELYRSIASATSSGSSSCG